MSRGVQRKWGVCRQGQVGVCFQRGVSAFHLGLVSRESVPNKVGLVVPLSPARPVT